MIWGGGGDPCSIGEKGGWGLPVKDPPVLGMGVRVPAGGKEVVVVGWGPSFGELLLWPLLAPSHCPQRRYLGPLRKGERDRIWVDIFSIERSIL